jgi:predicted ester cyclase
MALLAEKAGAEPDLDTAPNLKRGMCGKLITQSRSSTDTPYWGRSSSDTHRCLEVAMTTGDTEATPVDEVLVGNLIQRIVTAFNAHDADGYVAVMTEDVIFEHSAAPAPMHGRAEVSAFYTNTLWKAFPDLTMELMDGPFFHPHAPRISFNWLAAGTHTGPLDPPGLAPTGKRVEFDVREIAEIRNGLVSRIRLVVDMFDVMRQQGLFPAPGSRGEQAIAIMQRLQMKLLRRR